MDVLSDVLSAARSGEARSVATRAGSRFGLSFPAGPVAGFHVVVSGTCLVRLEAEPAGWHDLGPGDVVLLPHGAAHVLASDRDVPVRPWVPAPEPAAATDAAGEGAGTGSGEGPVLLCGTHALDAAGGHPLLADLPDLVVVRADEAPAPLATAVAMLAEEVRSEPVGATAARGALVDLVLVLLLRARVDSGAACRSGFGSALADPRLGPALRAVHAEPGAPWTVGSLARRAGLSRSAFARRFAEAVGEPPQAYVTRWRMDVAARVLREGDAPLAAVARQVGYASPFAFSRAFSRAHGVPPSRWRAAA